MTKQLFKQWFLAAMLLLPAYASLAQISSETTAGSNWSFRNAEGDILLTRDGRRTVMQGGSAKAQGILLGAKDMVQTGKGRAELQLQSAGEPASIILNLSENTSVVMDKLNDGVTLELLYGKLAVQSEDPVTLSAGNSAVVFQSCDAVVEYVSKPGIAQPALRVSCLEGEGEIRAMAETEGVAFPIHSGEALSLEYRVPFAYVERKSLEPSPAPAAEPAPLVTVVEPAAPSAAHTRSRRIRAGNTIAGILLTGAGAAMQGYSFFANPRPELKDRLFYGGYAPLTLGAVFLLGAVLDTNSHDAD